MKPKHHRIQLALLGVPFLLLSPTAHAQDKVEEEKAAVIAEAEETEENGNAQRAKETADRAREIADRAQDDAEEADKTKETPEEKGNAKRAKEVADRSKEAAERCPIFPGLAERHHWPFDDPSTFTGSDEEIMARTRKVRDAIAAAVRAFADSHGKKN